MLVRTRHVGDRGERGAGLQCSTCDVASSSTSSRGRTTVYDKNSPIHQRHRPAPVGTATSVANTPFSLHSPSCPVPVCNGNEMFARPAFGFDMRYGVTAMGVQQGMSRKPSTHQRDLPAVMKYQDHEKRKSELRKARREDGRATDAKQARKHGRITAVCVRSASPLPTHGEQRGGSAVQANPPFAGIPAARSGNIDKNLHLPDAKMVPSMPKDTITANVALVT